MADSAIEKIIQEAATLPPEQQRRLIELLSERVSGAHAQETIERMAAEQGKKPLDFGEVRKLGLFFPEEESVDDLVSTLRSLRQDQASRTLG